MSGKQTHLPLILLASVIIGGFLYLSGNKSGDNSGSKSGGRSEPKRIVICGFDYSGSTSPKDRTRYQQIFLHLMRNEAEVAKVAVYTFAVEKASDDLECVYDAVPNSPLEPWDAINKDYGKKLPKLRGKLLLGTYYEPFLKLIAESARSNPKIPVFALIFSDGEADDVIKVKERVKLDDAVQKLADLKNFRGFLIVPVKSGIRQKVNKAFAPLGDRVLIAGENDFKQSIEEFHDLEVNYE